MTLRNGWPLLLVLAGLVAGGIWLASEPTFYRAETTIVVARDGKPLPTISGTIAQVVKSDTVLDNAAQRLKLGHAAAIRSHVAVHTAAGALRITYDDKSPTQAVRVVQEVAVQLGTAVNDRFGLQATVFDPAHVTGKVSKHPVRDLGLGLLAGLVLAFAAWAVPQRRVPADGRYRISKLRRAVEQAADANPDKTDDWRAYLAVLASQADGDLIPHALDGVVRDVFAPLLSRE